MRVLDLFSGLGGWSAAFRDRYHDVVTTDHDPRFDCDVPGDILLASTRTELHMLGWYEVILASPPCEAFSVAAMGHHWTGGKRAYVPATNKARLALRLVDCTLELISELRPTAFIIENPVGMMRKLPAMQGIECRTVTYCQYGLTIMKPTDLWGGFPPTLELRPRCQNGDPCHEAAPRGAKTGTQGIRGSAERALIPYQLSEQVCIACEEYLAGDTEPRGRLFA